MKSIERISVSGLGKLGACIAATLAARGLEVVGIDIDPENIRKVNEGRPPVEKPLLAETISAGRAGLQATLDHRQAVATSTHHFNDDADEMARRAKLRGAFLTARIMQLPAPGAISWSGLSRTKSAWPRGASHVGSDWPGCRASSQRAAGTVCRALPAAGGKE